MTGCSMCYNTLKRGNIHARRSAKDLALMNALMYEEPVDYAGDVEVVHVLEVVRDQIGLEALREKVIKLDGDHAIAEGALAAGCRFFAGYPITPSNRDGRALRRAVSLGGRPLHPTTLENKMKCSIDKCGRCNVGKDYVCTKGPVYCWAELKELPQEY